MLFDALFVFFEVCVLLALAVAVLWLLAKIAGYVAMLVEGEPLIPTIRRDLAMTRRDVRRTLHPVRPRHPRPTA